MSARAAAVVLASFLAVGCASIGNVQMADTLGKGHVQVGVEPGLQALAAMGTGIATQPVYYPHIDASVRFGVTDFIDLGLRGGWSFLEAQGKFLFTRPGDPHLAVSLAPTVGGMVIGFGGATGAAVGMMNIGVPVLIGIKIPGGSEFVIGPRLQNMIAFAGASNASGTVYFMSAGGSLGFAWRITDSFALMPEVAVVFPIFGTGGTSTSPALNSVPGLGTFVGQFKLGLLIGRMRDLAPPEGQELQQLSNPPLPPPPPPPPPQQDSPPPPPPPAP